MAKGIIVKAASMKAVTMNCHSAEMIATTITVITPIPNPIKNGLRFLFFLFVFMVIINFIASDFLSKVNSLLKNLNDLMFK